MSVSPHFIQAFAIPVLASEVGDIGFVTDEGYAEISVELESSSELVYKARIYPNADGICTAYDVGDAISKYMVTAGIVYNSFVFKERVSSVVMTVLVLQSIGIYKNAQDVFNRPLLSSDSMMIPSHGEFCFYVSPGSSIRRIMSATVTGRIDDGSIKSCVVDCTPSSPLGSVLCLSLCPNSLLESINNNPQIDDIWLSITSISIIVGSPVIPLLSSFAIINDDPDLVGFEFYNCFGLREQIWMHCEVLPDISIDSDSAVMGHRVVQYDVESSQSFKVEAANITESEWPRVSQFLTSHEVYEISTGRRIFLSDISQNPCRTYDALGSLKFSFCYDDNRLIF